MKAQNLHHLLMHEVRDLYSGEKQILEALPELIEKTSDDALRKALESHLEETRGQKRRLEEISRTLDIDPEGERCKGMAGIIAEGRDVVDGQTEDADALDAAIIAAAQRVEHYEIAGYGTAVTYARMLGEQEVADRLREILDEEKEADRKLTEIAEDHVNRKAMKTVR